MQYREYKFQKFTYLQPSPTYVIKTPIIVSYKRCHETLTILPFQQLIANYEMYFACYGMLYLLPFC